MIKRIFLLSLAFACLLVSSSVYAQKPFSELVGSTPVKAYKKGTPTRVSYITWGAESALFKANGNSLVTKSGSTFDKLGLKLQLKNGDDFVQQCRDYLQGEPIMRGTHRMLGQASEVLGSDPRTKPHVFLQLSFSGGDHIVSRSSMKNLNDLTGKKIACQQGGPHVGLLYDALSSAGLSKDDVTIEWVADLSGPNGPAEAFRKDSSIDACCVITPDMEGLTGGLEEVPTKDVGGLIKGSHVLVSTQQLSRSVTDIWWCRSDFAKSAEGKAFIEKFVAGYLKEVEWVVSERKAAEANSKFSTEYRALLTFMKTQFNKDANDPELFPDIEVATHGLVLDCFFVGLPGQISFFQDKGNLNGFEAKTKVALDMATSWGYAKTRLGFNPAQLDYKRIAALAKIEYKEPAASTGRINAEATDIFPDSDLDDRTIVSFSINFDANQDTFSVDQYGAEFQRAIKATSDFGNAVVVIRGHADPTKTLVDFIRAGMAKGIIKRTGSRTTGYNYFINGKPLDLTQTEKVIELVSVGAFAGTNPNPLETMAAALNLSKTRAEAVKREISAYAKANKLNLDITQVQAVGAGIKEPVIAKPRNLAEAGQNRRVEFRIVKVPAEALLETEFDF